MKTRAFPYLLPFCVFFLFGCGPTASHSPTDAITFDTANRLDDFDFAASGDGGQSNWSIIDNDAGRGLAQIDPEPNENRLAFALYHPLSARDVNVSTRFMTNSSEVDRAAGVCHREGGDHGYDQDAGS